MNDVQRRAVSTIAQARARVVREAAEGDLPSPERFDLADLVEVLAFAQSLREAGAHQEADEQVDFALRAIEAHRRVRG
jgi:hypothetical protein